MGININCFIAAKRINQEDWARTYIDTLKLVKAGGLSESACINILEHDILCVVPAEDKNGSWHSIGDIKTGLCTEEFSLKKDISKYADICSDTDIRYSALDMLYTFICNEKNNIYQSFCDCFGGKTQGENPHKTLLAIACVIANDFPEYAVVFGDITQAQCMTACAVASKVLGRYISMPLQYDFERLYAALQESGYIEYELFEHFMCIYMGLREKNFVNYIRKNFPDKYFTRYFEEKAAKSSIEYIAKEWLEYGFSLDDLCEFFKRHYTNGNIKDLINTLILGKVYIEEKEDYDFTVTDQHNENPDNVDMQFSRMMAKMKGFGRCIIMSHIPLDEIADTLKKHFGNVKIDEMINNAVNLIGDEYSHAREVEDMYSFVEEMDKAKTVKYDVETHKWLILWSAGYTVEPTIWQTANIMLRRILGNGKALIKSKYKDLNDRIDLLCGALNSHYTSTEEFAEKLLKNAGDDEFILPYIALADKKSYESFDELNLYRALWFNEGLLGEIMKEIGG